VLGRCAWRRVGTSCPSPLPPPPSSLLAQLAHFNPLGLPLIEGNAGEGFVVRLAVETTYTTDDETERGLAKVKNPAFSEVAYAPAAGAAAGGAGAAATRGDAGGAGGALADKYLLPMRAAAVASKRAEADLAMKNVKPLADALVADAVKDMTEGEAASMKGDKAVAAEFGKRAVVVMRAFLADRAAT
jgi:hypothetical protein